MSIDMGVTFGSLGVLGPRAIIDVARMAQQMGYRSLWTVEATGTDAISLLGAASAVAPQLDLATGIVPVAVRTPPLAAMSAATLQALSPDADVWLGVGVSAPGILRQHGAPPPDRPIARMREYVALLRECLSGEAVTFEGDFWSVKRFRLGMRLGERKPKIVLAALGPQMLKLAGEIADGVLLNYIPVSHVGPSIEQVRAGGNARIFAYVHASVTEFERGAKSARKDLFNYAMADGYANMFRAAGFSDEVDQLRDCHAQKDREGALAAITEQMIQAINFVGDKKEVTAFTRSYIDAGVEHPVLMPMPWADDRWQVTEQTMSAAIAALQRKSPLNQNELKTLQKEKFMAQAKVVETIDASADAVWQILGNFKGIQPGPGIDAVVYEGEGVGMTRTISTSNGDVVEQLNVYEPEARQFAYAITNDAGPLPFALYSATVAVNDNGDGTTTVEWTGTFEPKGVDEETAVKFATGIYTRAIDGARTALTG